MGIRYLNPVFFDKKQKIYSDDRFIASGRYHNLFVPLTLEDSIPMPEDTILFELPERIPVVFNKNLKLEGLTDRIPVAAFIPPGYTQTLLAPFIKKPDSKIILPLYSYSAVGYYRGRLFVSAIRVDRSKRHSMSSFDEATIEKRGKALLKLFPKNRLIKHLVINCAFNYRCPNARNLLLNRSEAPLVVSHKCNSGCLGCISFQKGSSGVKSSQNRIDFIPTVDQLIEVAEYHIENTKKPILSFGQGCEGEPLLSSDLILEAIKHIKKRYKNVTININTNGSLPDRLRMLFSNGLDSARISLNSAREDIYKKYYKPAGYSFEDVLASIHMGKSMKMWISLNYFVFPGITDSQEEYQAFRKIIKMYRPSMIQLRNFNIDPDWYIEKMEIEKPEKCLGIKKWLKLLSSEFPYLKFGYFNPYLKR